MTDIMTSEQRHVRMSHIRSKDTKPEMVVRRWLWSHGIRYRLHSKKLAGSPDIVIHKLRTVIFINGCFWHGHNAEPQDGGELLNSECCKIPHSNRQFWLDKINRNRERDLANTAALQAAGWRVITIWECDLKPKLREETLAQLMKMLQSVKAYETGNLNTSIAAEPDVPYGQSENSNVDYYV